MIIGIDGNEANIEKRVGSNIYAYKQLYWINKLDQKNLIRVYLKSAGISDFPKASANWKYRVLKPRYLWTRWRLPLDLFLKKPQPNVFFTPGHYAPLYCPAPKAISIMDLSYLHFPKLFYKKDLYKLTKWTKQSILKAEHIFTISNFNKNDIIKNYHLNEDKISVTYPGVDENIFKLNASQDFINKTKAEFQIPEEFILYIGTLQPRKNLKRLFEAFSQMVNSKIKLVIVGKQGWHFKSILKKVKKLNLSDRIIFTGYLSDRQKVSLIKSAKCLVLVSLYEGFGIPVLEAMCFGKPVVIADNSSLPEITGDIGIQVNPYSTEDIKKGLTQAIQLNKEEIYKISQISKKRINKFNWQKSASQTLEVLYEIAV